MISRLLLVSAVLCTTLGKVYFKETFDSDPLAEGSGWVVSDWKKDDGTQGKWTWEAGPYNEANQKGLKTSEDAKFYAISKKFPTFNNKDSHLVFQFQIRHPQDLDCGGGYVKLLGDDFEPKDFKGETGYKVMFGPDICGYTKRTHVIIQHEGENKLRTNDVECESSLYSTVYRLELNSDSTYKVSINGESKADGKLKDDWDIEKPKKIKDPSKPKPSDWVDEQEIDDPEDTKPDDYDKPKEIVDPKATKPDDWDDEDDGAWEAPMIANPEYKGEWKAKRIKNPAYKGEYEQPEIDNPEYKEVTGVASYDAIGGIGIELWQVKAGTVFDNIIVTDSLEDADAFVKETCPDYKCGDDEKAVKEAQDKKDEEERKKKEEEEEAKKKAEEDAKKDDDETKIGDDDMADLEKAEEAEKVEEKKEEL